MADRHGLIDKDSDRLRRCRGAGSDQAPFVLDQRALRAVAPAAPQGERSSLFTGRQRR